MYGIEGNAWEAARINNTEELAVRVLFACPNDIKTLLKQEEFKKLEPEKANAIYASIITGACGNKDFDFLNLFILENKESFDFSHGGLRITILNLFAQNSRDLDVETIGFLIEGVIANPNPLSISRDAPYLIDMLYEALLVDGENLLVDCDISMERWETFVKEYEKSLKKSGQALGWEEEGRITKTKQISDHVKSHIASKAS